MKKLELLAPAKDLACGLDAVNCGADAVYIGADAFGARRAAANPVKDVEKLAAHAHKYGARVYAAVNTLLTDAELPRAVRLIRDLWNAGADAAIVQDMGLLEQALPPIPLFASTQCDNSTPEKVLFLEKAGFRRVILARELSLPEIKKIRAATAVDLECFVHGALCVSYSGQCRMSFYLGGRSGNRGECAQPCRLKMSLESGSGEKLAGPAHLLSLKDLNHSAQLGPLAAAGITSFKIEGRLKDRDYVRNVVAFYRRKLDALIAKGGYARASYGRCEPGFEPDLSKTFNRGYTAYCLNGPDKNMGSPETPKFAGEPMGRARECRGDSFVLDKAVSCGDGLSFFDAKGELSGLTVNRVNGRRVYSDKASLVREGDPVSRNLDREFLRALEKAEPSRLLGVALTLSETPDGIALTAVDEAGRSASVTARIKKEPARDPAMALETARRQLGKTGGSDFYPLAMEISLKKTFFIPVSTLNALRRDALEKLAKAPPAGARGEAPLEKNSFPYPAEALDYRGNVLNRAAADFYRRHGVKKISPAAEGGADLRGAELMTVKHCLRRARGICPGKGAAEPLFLVLDGGSRFRLEFDCERCLMRVMAR
ncbi:MAG: U32 family peptidase [Elusimicrobiota bacterium]|jgi:putative protease